jgi:hypothetical protein
MGIDKARELADKQIVNGQGRAVLQVKNLACPAIGVDHILAALDKDVARQGFEERPLLRREYGNFSF